MNYLVAVDAFFPDRPCGAGRIAWDIAQVMRDRGHHVTVFCRKQKPDCDQVRNHEGVRVIAYEMPRSFSLDPLKVSKRISAGSAVAQKHLMDTKWDTVHIHFTSVGKMAYNALGPDNNYVYTMHSPDILEQQINWAAQGLPGKIKLMLGEGLVKKMEQEMLNISSRIHVLSNFTKEAIKQLYGLGHKVTVIPHWYKKDFLRTSSKKEVRHILDWHSDARILFSVRRLESRMGLDIAIKALEPLLKTYPDVFFAIAGEGPLEKSLKQLAQSLGVADKVWFLGQVSDDVLKKCYEAADLFILPTRKLECFGIIILEALAFGLPIISSDAGAIPELMRPILPNCIVPAGNVSKLREKVQDFLTGTLDIPSSQKLLDYLKSRFSLEMIEPKLWDLLAPRT